MAFRSVKEFLALKRGEAPTPAERAVIRAVQAGEPCVLSKTRPEAATPDNTVRAGLLRLLITGATPECGTQDYGVRVEGAWITGVLDLGYAKARGRTVLDACHFVAAPQFPEADLNLLSLEGSHLPGFFAQGMRLRGSLFLRGAKAMGTVSLNGAKIGGQLSCAGAELDGPEVDGKRGKALDAQGVETGESLFLRGVKAKGTVDLNGAKIGGSLNCDGAELDGPEIDTKRGVALYGQGVQTGQNLFLRSAKAKGTVDLNGAKISGQMSCDGAELDGEGNEALKAFGVRTGEALFLRGVKAKGTLNLNGAMVGGQMACDRAELNGAGSVALQASWVETGGSLLLPNVQVTGTVDLHGAKIGGRLFCDDARFDGVGKLALITEEINTRGHVLMRRVHVTGTLKMLGGKVGGQLNFDGAQLDGAGNAALIAHQMNVAHGLFWRSVTVIDGAVSMNAAHVSGLRDDGRWPGGKDALDLDGFTYDRIAGNTAPLTAAGRRGWLRAGSVWEGRFRPQPYTQLARVFRAMGHGGEARTVLYWREQAVFRQARRDLLAAPVGLDDLVFGYLGREVRAAGLWAGDWLLRIVAGYGYRPLRALGCLIVLWAVAFALAAAVWQEGSFAPNSDVVLVSSDWQALLARDCIGAKVPSPCLHNPSDEWSSKGQPGMDWESFSSWGYALDLVVPVLDLGQTDAWAPSKDRGWWGWGLWWGRWVLIAFGWIVTAIGAAAVTGIMQKDRE